ncbi:MAG: tripartite tricarboxylate transporter TctB family protein [Rhodospirillaceae bacterium]|nr:tripartite tricarboxylate transporter TctB family protein [Rhodospirillaceae bacterium]
MTRRINQWIAIGFFAGLVALVFQQVHTSMSEQGIASGGPYDNAATFPKSVAKSISGLLFIQIAIVLLDRTQMGDRVTFAELKRPIAMLLVFAVYLAALTPLGYHLTTAPMILAVMGICGVRSAGKLLGAALAIAFIAAFIFEKFLSVVLPGGMLALHMPW